jgi:hypothetical protein
MKAFPLSNMTGLNQQGMDLRDYFAAENMKALIQASASLNTKHDSEFLEECSFENAVLCGFNSHIELSGEDEHGEFKYTWARHYAEEAYALADEMMKQRERK